MALILTCSIISGLFQSLGVDFIQLVRPVDFDSFMDMVQQTGIYGCMPDGSDG